MITLHRTRVDDFAGITDVNRDDADKKTSLNRTAVGERNGTKEDAHYLKDHQKDSGAERLDDVALHKRMDEYQKLMVRDAATTLPAFLALLGVGLAGMHGNWKMPKLQFNPDTMMNGMLGKAKAGEAGIKKNIRKAGTVLVENLFGSDTVRHAREHTGGKLDIIDQALLPDKGNWAKVSNLMSTLVWAMPTYMALSAYSRDELEKPEIGMRAGAFVIANLLFPNAIKSFLDKRLEGKHIPGIGGKENIALLASLGMSTVLYTLLPVVASHITRKWREEQIEKRKALGESV